MVAFSIPYVLTLAGLLVVVTSEGILAVALATAALQATVAPLQALIVSRQLSLPLLASLRVLIPPLVAAGAMTAVLLALNSVISDPVPALLVEIPIGAAVYLGALWLLAGDELRRLRGMAFPKAAASSG